MSNLDFSIKILIILGILISVSIIVLAFYYIFPHLIPFIIAYLVALMLESINTWIVKNSKITRGIAVNITFFLFSGLISLLAYFIITKIIIELIGLIKFIQKNIPNIQNWFLNINQEIDDFLQLLPQEISMQVDQTITDFVENLSTMNLLQNITAYTVNITTAIPNYFIILILFFVSLYLISINLPRLNEQFFGYFKEASKKKLKVILKDLRMATVGFLQAQLILSTITYLISLTALVILGVNYSLAIALLIVLVDILPILGTGSVIVPWAVFSFTRGDTFLSIGLIILFIIIIVVRRIIEPKILGERIGLSPLITLISIWVGFKVLGIIGVFLGPLLLILYKALVKAGIISYKLKI